MVPGWKTALLTKAKVAGVVGAAIAAGGVGGTVALSHVAPVSQQVVTSASSTPDPETSDAQTDPESSQAGTPTPDPESTDAQDPETGGAQSPGSCPAGVKNHGAYVSSVARSAPHGKGGVHGRAVSAAAKSDCGKDKTGATGGSGDPESNSAAPSKAKSGDDRSSDAGSNKTKSADTNSADTNSGSTNSGSTNSGSSKSGDSKSGAADSPDAQGSTDQKSEHAGTKPSHTRPATSPGNAHAQQH